MKRLFAIFTACILLCGVVCIPASAETAASGVHLLYTVTSEGDCRVTATVNLRLEAAHDKMTFPLPANATNITLNGVNANVNRTATAANVDISRITKGYIGDAAVRFEYTIPDAVEVYQGDANDKKEDIKVDGKYPLRLTIPLLSGFEYPVESLNFTITMPPGEAKFDPYLYSTYLQNSAASSIHLNVSGSQIIGSSKTVMNDHESINLTMVVPEEMFPTVSTYVREGNPELVPIIVFAALALLYWFITLRTLPITRIRTSTSPEGVTAGELGCRLTLTGGDLTMMVFTWAQLGYLLIHLEGNGKVLLHKRMDMGNERGPFENKVYRMLFGNRRVVDATGMTYARLSRKVASIVPQERNVFRGNSGNMKIFRGLACVSQIFCGICVAMNMTGNLVLAIVMAVILGIVGAVTGWLIQDIAYRTHLRGKVPVLIGFICILLWVLLGLFSGQVWIPLGCSVGQFLYGYLAAYGGRRSELGRHDGGQVLGLRHYLKRLPKNEINRLLMNDPDYFFNMAPYALALGVINPYAKAFGQREMHQCPYLHSRIAGKRTAEEWGHLMADAADLMDAKSRMLQIQKWIPIEISLKRKK